MVNNLEVLQKVLRRVVTHLGQGEGEEGGGRGEGEGG